ncbi:FadR/GntR family transcriptional regulator [Nocardioides marmorisolisilvae]|uniref:FadR family transcriptional regulator n=1 Tax=Nocardioides marmorisolisilvae TaxID=1542737 RepID=A0A3N0DTV3_9ACTN|nr:GntR family transcriptional regulator [Nocardioides marmorisolisilvae]RNL79052.1 FadR family transcriptional regulator [Nocardioides marmorisolisilvae]
MELTPITKRLVPDDVFEQLISSVVDGSLEPGEALPSERRLAELLGVSRPAVREALQRLSATRLVEVRHGGSTTVRDYQKHAGLDLLPRLLVRDGELDTAVARSIIEARLAIGPDVARMAAERAAHAPQPAGEALGAALTALEAAETPVERQHAALAFWDVVVDCADSIVFRLMFNNLRQAYEPAIEPLAPLLDAEVSQLEGYQSIRTAVLAGNGVAAAAAADALLRPATVAIVNFLSDYEDDPEGATP